MPKIYSPEPVFIQNIESLENYLKKQKIQFVCIRCNNTTLKSKGALKDSNYQLLCRKCLVEQTLLKHYGVTNPTYISNHVEKVQQTCLEKYGCKNPAQSNIVKEKAKQTCLKKYGFVHATQSNQIKEKIKQTCLKKYGVENPSNLQEIRNKISNSHVCRSKDSFPSQSKTVQEKIKNTFMRKYGSLRAPVGKYTYKGQFFDSSWELAVYIWALDQGKQVIREPISLEYELEGKIHYYHPDFNIDGQLIEVKGDHFFKEDGSMYNPYNNHKDTALFEAKYQCGLQHNVQFWSKKEIQPILKYMKKVHGKYWKKQFIKQ